MTNTESNDLSQMNAKIDQLEAKLNDQYNINHEIISSLAKLQNDQSLFQKDHLKQMEDIKLCIEKLQKKSSNENIKESLSEAIKNTEIIESHFCKLSNDLNTQIQSNNEIIVSVHTKLDEMKTQNVQSKMCELSTNFDNHLKNSEQTMTSVYRKLDELEAKLKGNNQNTLQVFEDGQEATFRQQNDERNNRSCRKVIKNKKVHLNRQNNHSSKRHFKPKNLSQTSKKSKMNKRR